jgi:hypothetical protein
VQASAWSSPEGGATGRNQRMASAPASAEPG